MTFADAKIFEVVPSETNSRNAILKIAPTFGYVFKIEKWKTSPKYAEGLKPGRKEKPEADIENRPLCTSCGRTPVAITKHGDRVYLRKYCHYCADRNYKRKYGHRHIVMSDSVCAKCGFKPNLDCQLDVDHIDGNHYNDEPSNLQVLCANCHREKTFMNNENRNRFYTNGGVKVG